MVSPDVVESAASRLARAAGTGQPCPPVRDLLADDAMAAYEVQRRLVAARVGAGARIVGRKIGLTAPAVQRQLGVDRPDFGFLLDDMALPDDGVASISRLLQPRIEAEVAIVLDRDIIDPEASANSVRSAIGYLLAALEIVDSRIADWNISYTDTVADNASSGLYVLGTERGMLAQVEPREVVMSLQVCGVEASTGRGSDCLGDPLEALAWLARTAVEFGHPLRAGQVVLSGALGPMVAVGAGDVVHAQISGLGGVSVRFEEEQA